MLTRRRFLAASSLAALWSLPGVALSAPGAAWRNWSGGLTASPKARFAPADEAELTSWMTKSTGTIRPVGAGHSFSALVPTDGNLVVLDRLSGLIESDAEHMTATLAAGTRLSAAGPILDGVGQAMVNLPDIDRQTLAGAISTSTHGTGRYFKSLSGYVTSLRLVTPTGQVLDIDRNTPDDLLGAAAVSLGALGVVTRIGFQNRLPFHLRTRTWLAPTQEILDNFDTLATEWEHFEMMPLLHSTWSFVIAHQETTDPIEPVAEADDGGEFLNLIDATPVALRSTLIDTLAGQVEPTESIDYSYNALTNLRFDRFNEMEYSVPAASGPACVNQILALVEAQGIDVTIPLEYRIIAPDDTWLSMFNDGPRVSISVHRMAHYDYKPLFSQVEPIFWKYGGRPHWGKVHTLDHDRLRELYPKLDEFARLQKSLDPEGRMLNSHLRGLLFAR